MNDRCASEDYYHVTCRGNERKEIFLDMQDQKFFEVAEQAGARTKIEEKI